MCEEKEPFEATNKNLLHDDDEAWKEGLQAIDDFFAPPLIPQEQSTDTEQELPSCFYALRSRVVCTNHLTRPEAQSVFPSTRTPL
jgi:hypothetical protein